MKDCCKITTKTKNVLEKAIKKFFLYHVDLLKKDVLKAL